MDSQSLVDEIKKVCFSKGASISGVDPHLEFISNLEYLPRKNDYNVQNGHDNIVKNKHRLFYNHRALNMGKVRMERGIIDLFAESGNQTIAIEYDQRISLRYKSIEKLLQSDANILIGIVGKGTLDDNRKRIIEVMDVSGITDKKVLLIAVSEKASEEVHVY